MFNEIQYTTFKAVRIAFLIFCSLKIQLVNAQENAPSLEEFFTKLETIDPVKENLHYDTFPDFDFTKFEPLQKSYRSGKVSYIVGSTHKMKICTITFINNGRDIGTMSVYDFSSFKILTFGKVDAQLSKYPDFPIFCISKDSRFIVYLNKGFQYKKSYKPEDIASIQILRDDFFPVYELLIEDKYIRMLSVINYINGRSRIIDKIRVVIAFQPEKDKQLLVSGQSKFSEDCYIPRADFIGNLHPVIKEDYMPYWFYANRLGFE